MDKIVVDYDTIVVGKKPETNSDEFFISLPGTLEQADGSIVTNVLLEADEHDFVNRLSPVEREVFARLVEKLISSAVMLTPLLK